MTEENRRRKIEEEENETGAETKHIQYGLGKNALLMRVRTQTMNRWRNHKYAYISHVMMLN